MYSTVFWRKGSFHHGDAELLFGQTHHAALLPYQISQDRRIPPQYPEFFLSKGPQRHLSRVFPKSPIYLEPCVV